MVLIRSSITGHADTDWSNIDPVSDWVRAYSDVNTEVTEQNTELQTWWLMVWQYGAIYWNEDKS